LQSVFVHLTYNIEKKNVRNKTWNQGDLAREELFANDNCDQKLQLIKNTERLERSGQKLDDGYRITIETEHIGTQILEDLGEQREKLTRSRDRVIIALLY